VNLNDALPGFIAESADLLRDMEEGLLRCSRGEGDADTINLIFRGAHTVKGSAGLFGLDEIVSFVHVVETVLDSVRLKKITINDELVTLLLACKDHIQSLVEGVAGGGGSDPALTRRGEGLLEKLRTRVTPATPGEVPERKEKSAGVPALHGSVESTQWRLVLRFAPGVLTAGMDPLSFLRYLRSFCELRRVQVLADSLPPLETMDAQQCYLALEIQLFTDSERSRIEAAFEFVKEDCQLELTAVGPTMQPTDAAPASQAESATAAREAFENPAALVTAPASSGEKSKGTAEAVAQTVRVDAAKLDTLITRIGELITAAAGASLMARRLGNAPLEEQVSTLTSLVEQVREGAFQLRMVKIGGTFDRFHRVVHDVSRELGKQIHLELNGKDTELDKTVVEQIGDPLTHLVRNAIDHGIESAELRAQRGKSPAGTIALDAYHDSGNIVIRVEDDGGGLRRDKILAKARERGLISEDRVLSDPEIYQLIFEPGFSTAEQVTNLSGRGVGMDVVKRNITALRGSVSIDSVEGHGTTVTVRLPLTLAIINGFQISVGSSNFVLPLDMVEECIEVGAESGHDFTDLRGHILPFVRLRELVGTREPPPRRPSIVVVRHGAERAGIVVDSLLGELQTVIKPMGRMFRKVDYVSGSSILGTGEVALVLDVPALMKRAVDLRTRLESA
jgi:two-component system, chemotaxis family, sensor kinase CheA